MTTPAPTAHPPQAASGRSPTPAEQGKRRSRHADPPRARAGRLRCPSGPEARPRPLWPAGTGIVSGIHRPVIEVSTGRWCRSPRPADPRPASAYHPRHEQPTCEEEQAADPTSTGSPSRPPASSNRQRSRHEPSGEGTRPAPDEFGGGQAPHRRRCRLGLHRRGRDRRCSVLAVLAAPAAIPATRRAKEKVI
jgi:hypothetical protein